MINRMHSPAEHGNGIEAASSLWKQRKNAAATFFWIQVSVKHFLAPKRVGPPFNADFSPSLTKNNTIHKLSVYGTMI